MDEQVVNLCAATGKILLDVPVEKIKAFQQEMLEWFRESHTDIMNELRTGKELSDGLRNRITEAAKDFRSLWQKQGE